MRHKMSGKKLNRTSTHRASMLRNMGVSLILHEQILTTLPKAKALRPFVEKLVTKAKVESLASRRDLISRISDKGAVQKLFSTLAVRYQSRPGGYLRITKSNFRYGDMAPMAYIEFVDRDITAKGCLSVKSESHIQKLD